MEPSSCYPLPVVTPLLLLPASPELRTCLWYQFTCNNGQCVDKRRTCDGFKHCSDGSDESSCGVTPGTRLQACQTKKMGSYRHTMGWKQCHQMIKGSLNMFLHRNCQLIGSFKHLCCFFCYTYQPTYLNICCLKVKTFD